MRLLTFFFSFLLTFSPLAGDAKPKQAAPKRPIVVQVPQEWTMRETDLNQFLISARAVPYLGKDNKLAGFLLTNMDRKSPLRKLKLLDGDILTTVDGIELDNAGKGIEILQKIRDSKKNEVLVRLIRKDQPVEFLYRWKSVPKPKAK